MSGVCSIFSQILGVFSRAEFEQAVCQHRAEHHARGFSSWTQMVAMLFCHLGRAQSLREILQWTGCLRRQVEAPLGWNRAPEAFDFGLRQ